ncbi:MAG: holo-ACP synthase [Gammaproteobacteria bacterium]|nr:MAG: holo-ACP synthase [Gammaproteobacteria bacterium]
MIAIGTDIVDKRRIERLYQRHGTRFPRRILTPAEMDDFERTQDSVGFLARRFCAKEAISKVLGTGFSRGVRFIDLEIVHDGLGKPLVRLHGAAKRQAELSGLSSIELSISDERNYAVAFALGQAGSQAGSTSPSY